ncbi:hypothetical protein V5799_009832 [Amblyomma americanum]|uniref:STAS domain-containing protein n=1 Tax=Amblyomma americanum TaxID=6943 RepID=A0AAQ4FAK3_AMBAM
MDTEKMLVCDVPAGTATAEARVVVDRKALPSYALEEPEPNPKPKLPPKFSQRAAKSCQVALLRTPSFLLGLFPCIAWVRAYNLRQFLVPDVLAGLSTAVLHVPQGLVSAIIAGVDPVLGLYSSLYPALVYVFMGSSPYVSMGTFPVTALMTGVVVRRYTGLSSNASALEYGGNETSSGESAAGVATTLTLLSGLIQVAIWLLRLDRLAAIISPVMAEGFLTGCAVTVIVSQLPSLFGTVIAPNNGFFGTPMTVYLVAKSVVRSNMVTALLSLTAFIALGVSKGVIARKMMRLTAVPLPSDLILVAVATVASYFLHLDTKYNVKVVGHITSGFPKPSVPPLRDWASLLPDAAAFAIVQFVSAFSIAELFGRKHRLKANAGQEMLAYGMSSVVGSFFMCMPTGSALARSLVLKDVGARTQVSGLVSCSFVAVTLYVFAPLFRPLPECVLGAVVITVLVPMLFKLRSLPRLWKISRFDFALWLTSFLSVVFLDVTYGLMVGALIGLLVIFLKLNTQTGSRLQTRRPDIFVSAEPTAEFDKVTVYRFGGPLCFASHHTLVDDFEEMFTRISPPAGKNVAKLNKMEEADLDADTVRAIVMDCSAVSFIDSCGLRALDTVVDICLQNKCILYLAALPDAALRTIKTQGALLRKIDPDRITPTIQDAVAFLSCQSSPPIAPSPLRTYL